MRSFMDEAIDFWVAVALARSPGLPRERLVAQAQVDCHLVRLARQGDAGATLRDLQRRIRAVSAAELRDLVQAGVAAGRIEAIKVPSGPRGGRPTTKYQWAVRHNFPSSR